MNSTQHNGFTEAWEHALKPSGDKHRGVVLTKDIGD
jgi:hypothetical protein